MHLHWQLQVKRAHERVNKKHQPSSGFQYCFVYESRAKKTCWRIPSALDYVNTATTDHTQLRVFREMELPRITQTHFFCFCTKGGEDPLRGFPRCGNLDKNRVYSYSCFGAAGSLEVFFSDFLSPPFELISSVFGESTIRNDDETNQTQNSAPKLERVWNLEPPEGMKT